MQEVLEDRRARTAPIEEAIYDELQAQSTFAEYEYLPCRKRSQNYKYTLKDTMGKIDGGIAKKRVTPYKEWNMACKRYMGVTAFLCRTNAWAKLERSRRSKRKMRRTKARAAALTYGQKLLKEYHAYYSKFPLRAKDDVVDALTRAAEQRARKADWRVYQQGREREAREPPLEQ